MSSNSGVNVQSNKASKKRWLSSKKDDFIYTNIAIFTKYARTANNDNMKMGNKIKKLKFLLWDLSLDSD